jgi:hypothetical protein
MKFHYPSTFAQIIESCARCIVPLTSKVCRPRKSLRLHEPHKLTREYRVNMPPGTHPVALRTLSLSDASRDYHSLRPSRKGPEDHAWRSVAPLGAISQGYPLALVSPHQSCNAGAGKHLGDAPPNLNMRSIPQGICCDCWGCSRPNDYQTQPSYPSEHFQDGNRDRVQD